MAGCGKVGPLSNQGPGEGIAWDASEQGNFQKDYFNPVVIPTIKNIHGGMEYSKTPRYI